VWLTSFAPQPLLLAAMGVLAAAVVATTTAAIVPASMTMEPRGDFSGHVGSSAAHSAAMAAETPSPAAIVGLQPRPRVPVMARCLPETAVVAIRDGRVLAASSLLVGCSWLAGRRRPHARRRRSSVIRLRVTDDSAEAPSNLYELLGVDSVASDADIKKAYYDKMKVCHPDIAGEDGEEMCIILNDAYDLLSDPDGRAAYNESVQADEPSAKAVVKFDPTDEVDMKPTWKSQMKAGNKKTAPVYVGRPYSRSLWDRVDPDDRGEKHYQQRFVFVDEWTCIACRNCCDVAPRTFCIDNDAGRARVFAQWGDSEEYLDYAVSACPVDCIYWVSRNELQILEYVTREKLYETGNDLPCPMAARQGCGSTADVLDPFGLALEFNRRMEEQRKMGGNKRQAGNLLGRSAANIRKRIQGAFGRLKSGLREAGWGAGRQLRA